MPKYYRVTLEFTKQQLLEFMERPHGAVIDLEMREPSSEALEELGQPSRKVKKAATRRKRGSKVFDTILDRLSKGEAVAADLRSSLEAAGLSPSSLSTGLALLQKNGKIRRGDDGSYALAEAA